MKKFIKLNKMIKRHPEKVNNPISPLKKNQFG